MPTLRTTAELVSDSADRDRTEFSPYAPDFDRVEELRRATGLTWNEAHARLVHEAQKQDAEMRSIAPAAAREVTEARRLADEATERAAEATARHQALISGLEHDLLARAELLSRIELFRGMVQEASDLPTLADSALDAYLTALENPCPATASLWDHRKTQLAVLTALRPYLAPRLKALETEAATKLATIRKTAGAAEINLGALVQNMRSDATPRAKQLDAAGFLDVE